MARALGIPSRVVVGFHGGTYNSFGDFWKVSTKDAHAWAEVYYNGEWQRMDPTSWVAPLRIEMGAESFFELPEEERQSLSVTDARIQHRRLLVNWFDHVSNFFDHLNYKFTNFVLEFDKTSQGELFQELKDNLGWMIFALILSAAMIRIILRWIQPQQQHNDLQLLFNEICIWGDQHQFSREPAQTPLGYLAFLSKYSSEPTSFFSDFAVTYDAEIYGFKPKGKTAAKLRTDWRRLKKNLHLETGKPSISQKLD
jgi:hypothetical protein